MKKVYLDNNATTPLIPEVEELIREKLPLFGNPSSFHSYGQEVSDELDLARQSVANLLGCTEKEIIFTGSGTEANNQVLKGVFLPEPTKGNHLITSQIEHPAVLETAKFLEKMGVEVTILPVDKQGLVDPADLKKALRDNTALVSIMLANNEIGTIQPIKELAAITHAKGVLFHTDAVQGVGKIVFTVDELGVDFLSLSGHKFHAPKGVGALYVRKSRRVTPLLHGGHQENRRRGGTENTLGIMALGKAAELALAERDSEILRLATLRDKLYQGILDAIPEVTRNGHSEYALPNTLDVSFKYIEGESIMLHLDFLGVAVSTGSACSSGSLEPSHVLMALGLDAEDAHGSIRFSLGRTTTEDDIDHTLAELPGVIEKLRNMSPLYHAK